MTRLANLFEYHMDDGLADNPASKGCVVAFHQLPDGPRDVEVGHGLRAEATQERVGRCLLPCAEGEVHRTEDCDEMRCRRNRYPVTIFSPNSYLA